MKNHGKAAEPAKLSSDTFALLEALPRDQPVHIGELVATAQRLGLSMACDAGELVPRVVFAFWRELGAAPFRPITRRSSAVEDLDR